MSRLQTLHSRLLPLVRPRLITFDAYETLFCPHTPVHQVYAEILNAHHVPTPTHLTSPVTPAHIQASFPTVYRSHWSKHPNYGKGYMKVKDWWLEFITQCCHPYPVSPQAVEKVWKYFGDKRPYNIREGVKETLQRLRNWKNQPDLAIVSNSDPRCKSILKSLSLSPQFFRPEAIFLSYETGYDKPNPKSLEVVLDSLKLNQKIASSPDEPIFWHVGDDIEKDLYFAASLPHWGGILIDWNNELIPELKHNDDYINVGGRDEILFLSKNKIIISKFTNLAEIFGV
ncbi:HAD-like protein [Nadsonia fulvescens var. elongata DSM 6958]|uniref:HAD-like protein n=1 Tax=Nadsonia fulvescens var. elongata DSM 6958 TaxID=857566 RepID=A0A1E3PKD7_9ASCO|nr:HAD-like protein [Nadsonia fulvescens var. elongata DSM 6958]